MRELTFDELSLVSGGTKAVANGSETGGEMAIIAVTFFPEVVYWLSNLGAVYGGIEAIAAGGRLATRTYTAFLNWRGGW